MALNALKNPCPPGCVDEQFNNRVIAASSDLALVVDPDGVIKDVAVGGDAVPGNPGWLKLVGKRWVETIAPDSQNKVELLLREARTGVVPRARQINQQSEGANDTPFRFSAVLNAKEQIVALGRDLSVLSAMQQALVTSQQAMDREFQRLRQAETRYRQLFQTTTEGVVVVDATSLKIVESNHAAATLLQAVPPTVVGRTFESLFERDHWSAVETLVRRLQSGGRSSDIQVTLPSGRGVTLSGSLFRQSNTALLFFHLRPDHALAPAPRDMRMLAVVDSIPDSFVVIGDDKRILCANTAFCDLVQQPHENMVVGQPLDRWLGRPGVDLNLMLASLREHRELRNFATIIIGEYGTTQEAVVSGVAALSGKVPCSGFAIRPVSTPRASSSIEPIPRSVDQLRELVGRVSLKEIVRESADLIERLCIEVALQVSGDNRASAAQLLGLSRQGLYSKLRRHGIGDLTD